MSEDGIEVWEVDGESLWNLRGIAPGLTGDLTSEEFVRRNREIMQIKIDFLSAMFRLWGIIDG